MSYNAVLFEIYCLFFIWYKKIGLYIIYTCRNLCNTWSIRPKDKLNLYVRVYSKSWLHERKVIKDVIPKAKPLGSHVPTDTRFHTYCVLLLQVSYACKTPNRNIRTDCLPQLPLRTSVPQILPDAPSQLYVYSNTQCNTCKSLSCNIRIWGQYSLQQLLKNWNNNTLILLSYCIFIQLLKFINYLCFKMVKLREEKS